MNIGAAREKQSNYPLAVKAYERAADRYNDRQEVALGSDLQSRAGLQQTSQDRRV